MKKHLNLFCLRSVILDLLGVCSKLHATRPQLLVPMPGWLQRYEAGHADKLIPCSFIIAIVFRGFCLCIPQMLRREKVSKSCDVYSYAVLLFEIATQQNPFAEVVPIMVPTLVAEGKVRDSEGSDHFVDFFSWYSAVFSQYMV